MRIAFSGSRRRGTIVPMMAVGVTVLFAFVALAIDLGMIILARAAAQNAADTAALTGARTLDNRVPVGTLSDNYDNQRDVALTNALASVASNSGLNLNKLTAGTVQVGVYDYDATAQVFRPSFPESKPTGKAWTSVEVNVAANQPSFFSRVFGINSLPTSARAIAAHRPRDIAIILDMSGSMKFSSTFSWPEPGAGVVQGLMNPDTSYPRFGHYQRYPTTTMPNAFYRTTNHLQGSNEIYSPTNMTKDAAVGPAMVRQFVFDPGNISDPSQTITSVTNANNLRNAFHRWNPTGMSALTANGPFGRMSNPTGWTGYNAFDTTNTNGPTPAPDTFITQEDGEAKYVGDRYPRKAGVVVTTNVNWDPTTATGAARNTWELLFPTSVTTLPTLSTSTLRTIPTTSRPITGLNVSDARVVLSDGTRSKREGGSSWNNFVDSAWEYGGYDLDLVAYNATSGAATTSTFRATAAAKALQSTPAFPTNGRFHGYSMGPAYYGKTFFIWPPDPRWGNPEGGSPLGSGVRPDLVLERTNPTSTDPSKGVKDSSGNWICDWRRRFFLMSSSATTGTPNADTRAQYSTTSDSGSYDYFHPEADNDPVTSGTQSINQALLNTAGTNGVLKNGTFKVNYRAVLAWIKSGPQVFPPNLRAGRIKYYTSIPDHVDNAGSPGTNEANLDQRFWREYIDFVLGFTGNTTNYDPRYTLAGVETAQWGGANISIGSTSNLTYTDNSVTKTVIKPYMNYTDVPARPRMHFWFGPASMLAFLSTRLGSSNDRNMNAGTLAEAQTWQLKAGIRSAIDDIRNNHPNDQAGTTYFAGTNYTTIRVEMGQDWETLKNGLYYPKSLLAGIKDGSAPNAEKRPYTSSFGEALVGDLPNGNNGTDPVSGFALAYNLLSSSTAISGTGRRGATKIVIFETDGVPNGWRQFNFSAAGPNSHYTSTSTTGSGSNGDATSINKTYEVIDQIVAPTASNGFSLENSDARVYPIAFGDLFSSNSTFKTSALNFLQNVAFKGKSSDSASNPLPAYQVIVGTADERVEALRTSFERILQSGVQVTLIE
jgi:Flp pilus assembly protein TadG